MKVMERSACDNEYLHRDFHGALAYAISYLEGRYGEQGIREYLEQTAQNAYLPLIEAVKKDGLAAIESHYRKIFDIEGGKVEFVKEGNYLTLTVIECPALCHLKKSGQLYSDKFCMTTVVVNETVCRLAGIETDCQYNTEKGCCVQRFWRPL